MINPRDFANSREDFNAVAKMNKVSRRKAISAAMQKRAFELRENTGRGWSREQLAKDNIWSELNTELEKL